MRRLYILLILGLVSPFAVVSQVDTTADHFYLCTYFTGEKDGARLALSTDGMKRQTYNNANVVIVPTVGGKLMRDPMIAFDSATRTFHMFWTTSWNGKDIGYASSTNLKTWSTQTSVSVGAKISNCGNCWAPEIFYDDIKDSFMIFWSTETNASQGKRPYYIMTKDFKTFTDPAMLFDPGYTSIDWNILKVADKQYYLFFKDERDGKKFIQFVSGKTPQGPWGTPSKAITTAGCEGPSAIKIGNEYRVYFDPFSTTTTYRMVKVTNLDTTASPWPNGGTPKLGTSDFAYRHGSIIEIPRDYVMFLLYNRPIPTTAVVDRPLHLAAGTQGTVTPTRWIDLLGRTMAIDNSIERTAETQCGNVPAGFFIGKGTTMESSRRLVFVQ